MPKFLLIALLESSKSTTVTITSSLRFLYIFGRSGPLWDGRKVECFFLLLCTTTLHNGAEVFLKLFVCLTLHWCTLCTNPILIALYKVKHVPNARHYNPRFVYFLSTFWSLFMYCDLWAYVWLLFKRVSNQKRVIVVHLR